MPAAIITTTNAQGQTVETTSPVPTFQPNPTKPVDITTTDKNGATVVLSDVTSGEVITTTDAMGSTFVTTYTPNGGKVSSVVFKTTTGADGTKHTITSFVSADTSMTATMEPGATASTRNPSLQNGVATFRGVGREVFVALGAGMLGAAAFI